VSWNTSTSKWLGVGATIRLKVRNVRTGLRRSRRPTTTARALNDVCQDSTKPTSNAFTGMGRVSRFMNTETFEQLELGPGVDGRHQRLSARERRGQHRKLQRGRRLSNQNCRQQWMCAWSGPRRRCKGTRPMPRPTVELEQGCVRRCQCLSRKEMWYVWTPHGRRVRDRVKQ
jgi:hypothetical protein